MLNLCRVGKLAIAPFLGLQPIPESDRHQPLRQFWETHPTAEQPLKAWFDEAIQAKWNQPADIKAQYRTASVLKNRRVVFNIKGNDYRLIVAIAYKLGVVYIKFTSTHAEYDKIDAETVAME